MLRTLAFLSLLIPALASAADTLSARSDRYQVQWGSISLGEGTIRLTPLGGDCYRYESITDPVSLVRWTYGAPRETSEFCLVGGQVRAQRFAFQNDKRSKDSFSLEFDWKNSVVRVLANGELSQRPIEGPVYDRFVIREAARLWAKQHAGDTGKPEASFTMVEDDRIRTYRFAITGRETVDVPAGRFETLRVERVDNPRKSYRYWLAPSRDYLPVKIEHLKDGKAELRMQLLSK
jgi:hypothetical protein